MNVRAIRIITFGAVAAAMVGLGASVASMVDDLGQAATFCAETGCETVRSSAWARPLGIPMSLLGVAFYGAIGGFTAKAMQMPKGQYHVLESGGQPRAGVMSKMMPQQPHAWLPYVQVANADKTVEKAKKLGGTVIVPPTDVPNVGRFSVLADTLGAAIGILQP